MQSYLHIINIHLNRNKLLIVKHGGPQKKRQMRFPNMYKLWFTDDLRIFMIIGK